MFCINVELKLFIVDKLHIGNYLKICSRGDVMVLNKSIQEIIKGYEVRDFSPVEIIKEYVKQIKILNPNLNAFITVNEEKAINQALISESKIMAGEEIGILEGIPISYKDNIDTKGIITTSGSPIHKSRIPVSNAFIVKKLQAEGTVNIGKVNMFEFAFGITSKNPYFGDIKNPWNPCVTAGGSSGGSAVAVAANLCMGSIGTDTAGSIRVPSSCCGVVGLKPTFNLVNMNGIMPLSNSLDHAGPIARNVADLAILMEAITQKPFRNYCNGDIRGIRIGISKRYFNEQLDTEVKSLYEKAIRTLEEMGAILIEVEVPCVEESRNTAHILATTEVGYFHKELLATSFDQYSEGAQKTFDKSKLISAHSYIHALDKRSKMKGEVNHLFETIDILVTPTMPIGATDIDLKEISFEGITESVDESLIRFTCLFNITGHPALSIPGGLSQRGIPIGLQLIANHNREDQLITTAFAFEQESLVDFYRKREGIYRRLS